MARTPSPTPPRSPTPQGWQVVETTKFTKQLEKAGLQTAEEQKYHQWRAAIPAHGPKAAEALGYEAKKLKGVDNQWEFIIGKKARISYTIHTDNETIELLAVGHT